jgi:two-component system C4-dicarboxylate transport response regulator DctD
MVAVLLVEDDRDVRESLVEILEAEGHVVTPVSTARAALEVLEQPDAPALLLVDLRMPGMDGLSFLNAVCARADRDRFRVILMSADRAVAEFKDAPGVVAVLKKPFESSELLELVRRHAA